MFDLEATISEEIYKKFGVRIPVRTSYRQFDMNMQPFIGTGLASNFNRPRYEGVIIDFQETLQQIAEGFGHEFVTIRRYRWTCPSFGYRYALGDPLQSNAEEKQNWGVAVNNKIVREALEFFATNHKRLTD